tara:strand:+ start:1324 stop:1500 length:177 start_codon:yes stop_codon:yes gene_type:complete
LEDKSVLFFPPFAKSRTDGRKKKFFVRWKKNMKKNWHTLFFICYIKTLFFKSTNNNNV